MRIYQIQMLIIFFLLLSISKSFSQFNYGIRAGLQSSTLISNIEISPQWKFAYHIGVFSTYTFNKKISIVGDLQFSDKGYKSSADYGPSIYHFKYITLPIMLQYRITSRLSLLAGGEFGMLLSSFRTTDGRATSTGSRFGKPFDFGIGGGLSYQIDPRFTVMLRYIQGLSNILNRSAINYAVVEDNFFRASVKMHDFGDQYYNQVLQISLGYSLGKS